MTTIAIGYAFSQSLNGQSHLSPALFYNEPELDHLDWVNTIYPKFENPTDSAPNCILQLTNYLTYYATKQIVVIGGDISAVQAICNLGKLNLFLLHQTPDLIQKEWLSDNINVFNASDTSAIAPILSETTPQITPNVLVIDAGYWQNTADFDLLQDLSQHTFQIIMVTSYNLENDASKKLFTHLKSFIQQATS